MVKILAVIANLLKSLITLLLVLWSFNTYADLEVCNKSQKYPISIALAFQRNTLFENGNYKVSGWNEILPQKCAVLLKGDAKSGNNNDGYRFWLHAISNGIVLVDHGSTGDIKEYSNKQLCVSDDKFDYDWHGDGVTQNCSKKYYLAPFAISLIPFNDNPLVNLYPDEVIKNNPNSNSNSRPRLPDLYGALAISSTGQYSSNYLKDNIQEASTRAINYCKSNEPEATCKIIKTFKNQCISVAQGKRKPAVFFLGSPKSTEQDVKDSALKKCSAQGDLACEEEITVCSTYEEKAVIQKQRKDKIVEQAGDLVEEIIAPRRSALGVDPWDNWKAGAGARDRPSIYQDSPPECGEIYDQSMECAHKHDVQGSAFAKQTLEKGGSCYPLAHLAEICPGPDREQFENYKKELDLMKKGKLVYDLSWVGNSPIFYYYYVPKGIKFPIPDSEPLKYEKEGFYIWLRRDSISVGLLIQANIVNPHKLALADEFKDSRILECNYSTKGEGVMNQYFFWYKNKPDYPTSLDPDKTDSTWEKLRRTAIASKFRAIRNAAEQCPATMEGMRKMARELR